MIEPILDAKDLAAILRVKVGTIYSWMSRKVDLPPRIKISGKTTRWTESAVLKWMKQRERIRRRRNFDE